MKTHRNFYKFEIIALTICLLLFASKDEIVKALIKPQQKAVVGYVEFVEVEAIEATMKARIDTGAKLSSIDAEILEVKPAKSKRDNEIVVFKIRDDNGNINILEREVIKWVNMKNKGDTGRTRRPVVKMSFCLGGKIISGRVSLADREGFLYQVLVGRNFLETGKYLVDSELAMNADHGKCK